MKIRFDKKRDIMRIVFQDGKYEVSKEIGEGIIVDLTKDRKIIAIEILDASARIQKGELDDIALDISH